MWVVIYHRCQSSKLLLRYIITFCYQRYKSSSHVARTLEVTLPFAFVAVNL
jgi:hypothetical protein